MLTVVAEAIATAVVVPSSLLTYTLPLLTSTTVPDTVPHAEDAVDEVLRWLTGYDDASLEARQADRYADKLIDELAKGRPMAKILREM